jgi:hypothetical protein
LNIVVSVPAVSKQNGHSDTAAKSGMAANEADGGLKCRPVEEVSNELKFIISDSEIVVVEDTSQWNTNAVILKVTSFLGKFVL